MQTASCEKAFVLTRCAGVGMAMAFLRKESERLCGLGNYQDRNRGEALLRAMSAIQVELNKPEGERLVLIQLVANKVPAHKKKARAK